MSKTEAGRWNGEPLFIYEVGALLTRWVFNVNEKVTVGLQDCTRYDASTRQRGPWAEQKACGASGGTNRSVIWSIRWRRKNKTQTNKLLHNIIFIEGSTSSGSTMMGTQPCKRWICFTQGASWPSSCFTVNSEKMWRFGFSCSSLDTVRYFWELNHHHNNDYDGDGEHIEGGELQSQKPNAPKASGSCQATSQPPLCSHYASIPTPTCTCTAIPPP